MWPTMNTFLHRLTPQEKATIHHWSQRVFSGDETASGRLDAIMAKVPPLPFPVTVYRALKLDDWREVVYDVTHFVATATTPAAAKHFGGSDCCYMKIQLLPGAKVLPVSYAHGMTQYPKDMEILLPRQGAFKVIGSETIDIEQHEMSMYPPELAAMIAAAMAKSNIRATYTNEKLFIVVNFLHDGRMTRSLAAANTAQLRSAYGLDDRA